MSIEYKIPNTAVMEGRVGDFIMMGKVFQTNAFFAGVAEGHVDHAQMMHAVLFVIANNIEQLLAKGAHAVRFGIAPKPVYGESHQGDVIVMHLKNPIAGDAMHHRVGSADNGNRLARQAVADCVDILIIMPRQQVNGVPRLRQLDGTLDRAEGA